MEVGFEVNNTITVVGTSDFLHAFFSTISYYLEPDGWGTRFPELMNDLFRGKLKHSNSQKVLSDLKIIRSELKKCSPDKVIWEIRDSSLSPPAGDNIGDDMTDLSNYFVTSGGGDLFDALIGCLKKSIKIKEDVTIEKVPIYGRRRVTEVGFRVGDGVYIMGTPEFLHALFSTISYHLEPHGWGTRFPELMNHLFQGRLEHSESREALNELNIITTELKGFGPDEVIWHIGDLTSLSPPWRQPGNDDIMNLWECIFTRNNTRDLFLPLTVCLKVSIEDEEDVTIVRIPPYGQTATILWEDS